MTGSTTRPRLPTPFDPPLADGNKNAYASPPVERFQGSALSRFTLPEGELDDGPPELTVHGLGNRKNKRVTYRTAQDGVRVLPCWLRHLQRAEQAGLPRTVVSFEANIPWVFRVPGPERCPEGRVDEVTMAERLLPYKPPPAAFFSGLRLAGSALQHAAVSENFPTDGTTERAGRSGYVLEVERDSQSATLSAHGVDVEVMDLLGGRG